MMIRPVILEIVVPTFSGLEVGCFGCSIVMGSAGLKRKSRRDITEEYPKDLKEMLATLSSLVKELTGLYRHRLSVRIIDAQSPLGLWKQLRHRVFKTPAFIVDRKRTHTGWNNQRLEALIDECLRESH